MAEYTPASHVSNICQIVGSFIPSPRSWHVTSAALLDFLRKPNPVALNFRVFPESVRQVANRIGKFTFGFIAHGSLRAFTTEQGSDGAVTDTLLWGEPSRRSDTACGPSQSVRPLAALRSVRSSHDLLLAIARREFPSDGPPRPVLFQDDDGTARLRPREGAPRSSVHSLMGSVEPSS